MDPVYDKALKRLDELKSEIGRLEVFIRTYKELSGLETTVRPSTANELPEIPPMPPAPKSRKRRNNITRIIGAVQRVMKEADRPLTRGEIAEGLERLGVTVHATDVPKYLGTLLWRNSDLFVQIEGEGYALTGNHRPTLSEEFDAFLNDDDDLPDL